MPESNKLWLPTLHFCLFFFVVVAITTAGAPSAAQSPTFRPYYVRANTVGILASYSWDSSHMLLGAAEKRELLNVGFSYSRRLLVNSAVNWQYDGELLPVALESDPTATQVVQYSGPNGVTASYDVGAVMVTCTPVTVSFTSSTEPGGTPVSYTATDYCSGRQWTAGEGMSPIGMQWNFLPRHRIQPLLVGHGGYMYSTRAIPIMSAGSFNFTFDFGAGLEIFRSELKSIRIEYRYHHISNDYTASTNPGIDSGMMQVTYCFGWGKNRR